MVFWGGDAAGHSRPAQNGSGEGCRGCQHPGAAAPSARDREGEGFLPGVQNSDGAGDEVPVGVAVGAPGPAAAGLVVAPRPVRAGGDGHVAQTSPG